MVDKSTFKEISDLLLDIPGIIAFSKDFLNGRIRELRQKNRRADVIRLLPKLNQVDQDGLMAHVRRLATTSEPIYENDLMNGFGDAIPRDKEGNVSDEVAALAFLKWVANLDEAHFNVLAYMILHDPIAQRVKYYINWAVENHEDIAVILGVLERAIKAALVRGLMGLSGARNPMELRRKFKDKRDVLRDRIELQRGRDANGNKLKGARRLKGWVWQCMGW